MYIYVRERTPREKVVGEDFVKLMMCRGIRPASPPGKGGRKNKIKKKEKKKNRFGRAAEVALLLRRHDYYCSR